MGFLDDWRKNNPVLMEVEEDEARNDGGFEDGEVEVRRKEQCGDDIHKKRKPDRETKRVYNNTYRNKNKKRINASRRVYEQTPLGAYKKCKRRAQSKKQRWDISFENWVQVWNSCPKIWDDELAEYRLAWTMRGNDIQRNTQMRRKDVSKGWIVSNVEIIYRNQTIPEHGILAEWDWKTNAPSETFNIPEELK